MALPSTTSVSVKIIFLTKSSTQEASAIFSDHLYATRASVDGEMTAAKEIYAALGFIKRFVSLNTSAAAGGWRTLMV